MHLKTDDLAGTPSPRNGREGACQILPVDWSTCPRVSRMRRNQMHGLRLLDEEVIGFLYGGQKQIRRLFLPKHFNPDLLPEVRGSSVLPCGMALACRCPWVRCGTPLFIQEAFAHLPGPTPRLIYRADRPERYFGRQPVLRWKMSQDMTQAESRMFLRVDSVWIERMEDLTEPDMRHLGVWREHSRHTSTQKLEAARDRLIKIIDREGVLARSGERNPWMWAISSS